RGGAGRRASAWRKDRSTSTSRARSAFHPRRALEGVNDGPDEKARHRLVVVLATDHAPVVVQSMTNTDTADAIATAIQVKQLAQAGSEIVRITVNSPEAAAEVAPISEHHTRSEP